LTSTALATSTVLPPLAAGALADTTLTCLPFSSTAPSGSSLALL
jgi:hypothetical protein